MARPSTLEWVLWRVPVVGWAAAHLMQQSRVRPAAERARAQLAARPPVPADAWGDDLGRRELAYFLCQTLAREAGWPSTAFLPDDPVATLCHTSSAANLGSAVALSVGDRLRRPITTREWAWLETLTLGEMVDALLPHARRACPDCDYDLTGNVTGVCPECGARTRDG